MSKKKHKCQITKRPKGPAWVYNAGGTEKDRAKTIAHHEKQRARQGFSVYDWWSFDQFVAGLIANGVEDLRKNGHGYGIDYTEKEWKQLLKRIEKPLREYSKEKFHTDQKEVYLNAQEALKLFAENLGSMWD